MGIKHIRIIQLNANKCYAAQHEFLQYFASNDYHIALISEPYVGNKLTVKQYQGFDVHQFSNGVRVKACVLVKKSLGHTLGVSQLSTPNLSVIQLNINQRKLYIASAYIEPRLDELNTLDAIINVLRATAGSYLIIGGDLNGRHQDWGCTTADLRGNLITAACSSHQMTVCNTGSTPTFRAIRYGVQSTSIPDITIASDNLIDLVDNWKVIDACKTSDHDAIEFDIKFDHSVSECKRASTYLYNNKLADWTFFDEQLRIELEATGLLDASIWTTQTLDAITHCLTQCIRHSCFASMKLRGGQKPYNPWWNETLEKHKKDVIRLHHKLSQLVRGRQDITRVLQEMKTAKEIYAKEISKASTKNFREFCTKQVKEDVYSLTNRLIKDAPQQRPPSTLRVNNTFTSNSEDTAKALLNHFYPDDTPDASQEQKLIRDKEDEEPDAEDDLPFTEIEVINCLETMNPNRAPGHDNLTSDICLRVASNYPKLITEIMNQCLSRRHFPDIWKSAIVKILPKPGKDNYDDLASHRPIGLLPVFGKLLEKLFTRRLAHIGRSKHLWNDRQFGFKEQRSTMDALHTAIQFIKDAKRSKHQVIGVSLDIKAAFDNAWWPCLKEGLRKSNCPRNIFVVIKSYLTERRVSLNYGDASVFKTMSKGCVQGSVCGPTFWNLILDDLLGKQFPNGVHIQAFADDVFLLVRGRTTTEIQDATNEALDIIYKWGNSVKLTFSPSKTQAISFTTTSHSASISMNGVQIPFETQIKILGVIIDKNLSFTKHVKYVISKASKIFKQLCKFVRPTWGVHSDNVKTIYHQVIEPTITYASEIWGDAVKYKSVVRTLRSFQRKFAIRAIRAFHTVSAVSASALSGFMPLHIKIKEIKRIENIKRSGVCPSLPDDVRLEKRSSPEDRLHHSRRPHIKHTEANNIEDAENLKSDTNIYTDGSKLDTGEVGASYLIYNLNGRRITKKLKLNRCCSVFQAELLAIADALEWATKNLKSDATLFSDSLSAIKAIENFSHINPLVNTIHQSLNKISGRYTIRFVWVKAHIGIPGNEEADALAKQAALAHTAFAYNNFPISFAKNIIKEEALAQWASEYTDATQGSTTRVWFPHLSDALNFINNNEMTFETTQVLTGHGFHKEYLHRFKITPDAFCPCDGRSTQTLTHILKTCPRFSSSRFTYETLCSLNNIPVYKVIIPDARHIIDFFKEIVASLKLFNET